MAFQMEIKPPTMKSFSVMETFVVLLQICFLTGLVLSSPWVFYQLWSFVAAGLYPQEKRLVNVYMPYSIGLFLIGVLLCQFFVIPKAIEGLLWFNEWLDVEPELRLSEWLWFAILMPLVFGISFQTPLVMFFAEQIGVVDVKMYRKARWIAWFLIFVLAAVILPSPDVLSALLLAGPVCLLYEFGIKLCDWNPRKEFDDSDAESQELIEV